MKIYKYIHDYDKNIIKELSKDELAEINTKAELSLNHFIDCLLLENSIVYEHRYHKIDIDVNTYNEIFLHVKLTMNEVIQNYGQIIRQSKNLDELNVAYSQLVEETILRSIKKDIIPTFLIKEKIEIQLKAHLYYFMSRGASINGHFLSALHLIKCGSIQETFFKAFHGMTYDEILEKSLNPNQRKRNKFEPKATELSKIILNLDEDNILYPIDIAKIIKELLNLDIKAETIRDTWKLEIPKAVSDKNSVKREDIAKIEAEMFSASIIKELREKYL